MRLNPAQQSPRGYASQKPMPLEYDGEHSWLIGLQISYGASAPNVPGLARPHVDEQQYMKVHDATHEYLFHGRGEQLGHPWIGGHRCIVWLSSLKELARADQEEL
jgi:hypothetical protein